MLWHRTVSIRAMAAMVIRRVTASPNPPYVCCEHAPPAAGTGQPAAAMKFNFDAVS